VDTTTGLIPMTRRIYLSPPDVGPLEESFLLSAVRSGWVAPVGPDLDAFEREMAERTGRCHAVALSSGTAALHLSLLGLDVHAGDVVVVPTLTFAATANAAVYIGAEPYFVDCEPDTGNIDVPLLAGALDALRREGRRVGAVLPVDMFGSCAAYDILLPLCASRGIPVVEDAAEAMGTVHMGRPAGSFGHAAVLSFNGNKIMTTSSGGMLVTDDGRLAQRCRYLATQARMPVAHYEHTEIGYNYRLSNLLAALGRAQLLRLDAMITRRQALRERYRKLFASVPGVRLLGDDDTGANCWLTVIVVEPELCGWSAGDLGAFLAARGIETRPVWKPMHLQPAYAGARALLTGAAQRLFETGLTLPSGSALRPAQIDRVTEAIGEFMGAS
jgi:dTDP-4-amino-4,6-dideoxygalactose transaminase